MIIGFAPKIGTDPRFNRRQGQRLGWFQDATLRVHPVRFNRIQPGTVDGQKTQDDPHPCALPGFDAPIVRAHPRPHLLAPVPRGVIPDHHPDPLAFGAQSRTAPGQELRGDPTDGPSGHKADPDPIRSSDGAQQHAIARDRLGFRCWHSQRMQPITLFGTPRMQVRLGDPAPPGFILKTQHPPRLLGGDSDQSVPLTFFLTDWGSGLAIQCLAWRQRRPKRSRALRMVSSLTRWGVSPSAKATSATPSKVHTLVAWWK